MQERFDWLSLLPLVTIGIVLYFGWRWLRGRQPSRSIGQARYSTFHTLAGLAEGVAWVMVVLGVILGLTGFASGGILGGMSRSMGQGEHQVMFRFLAALPGLGTAVSGLFMVVVLQYLRAGVDSASMTAELLEIARRQEAKELEHDLDSETD